MTEQPDFAEKFVRLTRGLAAESISIIIRILIRQEIYFHNNNKYLDLFTRVEQEEIRLLRENLDNEILQLSENLFAYRNFLLPINHFEASVFYFRHGLNDLETLSRVKGKAILDVGGFIGDSVLIFSELEPSVIYTFEAVPDNFELLKQTLFLNHVENVVAENIALGP